MAYVYRHIRLDKNTPFYIGIGEDKTGNYKRAYDKHHSHRNQHWLNIVKNTPYEVEIILDNLEWEDACKKEIEFILLYGREKDGGLLTNLTLGGDGRLGFSIPRQPHVTEAIVKATKGKPSWNKGIPQRQSSKDKYKKSMEGKWRKGKEHHMFGAKMPEERKKLFMELSKSRIVWNKGKTYKSKTPNALQHLRKKVIQLDLNNNFIAEHDSLYSAAIDTGSRRGCISKVCSEWYRATQHNGFKWKWA